MVWWVSVVVAGVSLLGNIIVGLVAWGWRAEISTLRAEMATMRAEMRASIAESANEFFRQINGNYVKKEVYNTLIARVDGLDGRVNDLGE